MRTLLLILVAATASASPLSRDGFVLRSPAFVAGAEIPVRHTCDGADVSPALTWSGAPAGTRAFALVVEDPDAPDPAAPKRVWTHWVLYDLPLSTTSLVEDAKTGRLPAGTREGRNDWGDVGYRGPCPPIGRHRYFIRLYALDAPLPDLHGPTIARLRQAIRGHVLAVAELMGTFPHHR